jgi:hypothetical protein
MSITNRQFLQRSSVSLPAPYRRIRRVRQNQPCACRQDMAITTHGKRRVRLAQDQRTARGAGVKGPKPGSPARAQRERKGERDEGTHKRRKCSSRKGATSEKTERQRTTLPVLRRPCRRDRPPHGSSWRTGSGSGSGRSCQRQGRGYIAIRGHHSSKGRQVHTLRHRPYDRHGTVAHTWRT